MRHAIDLTKYWERRTHGDITAYYTWLRTDDDFEQALVLIPTHRQSNQKTTPCVVPLQNAWKWDETLGEPEACAQTCMQFAEHMGFNAFSAITCQRIASIIRDGLGDLISIPPRPVERVAVADATIINTDGSARTVEVTENV